MRGPATQNREEGRSRKPKKEEGHPDENFYHRAISWALRLPLPPPASSQSTRRFSATATFRQGPRSVKALEGALRLASCFSYASYDAHVLVNSFFLRAPDFLHEFGFVRNDLTTGDQLFFALQPI